MIGKNIKKMQNLLTRIIEEIEKDFILVDTKTVMKSKNYKDTAATLGRVASLTAQLNRLNNELELHIPKDIASDDKKIIQRFISKIKHEEKN